MSMLNDDLRQGLGLGLGAALAGAVLLTRTYIYPDVFRKGDIVLLENDPYYYRYTVEGITAGANGPLDPTLLTNGQTSPLTVATLAWVAELLGGDVHAVGTVLAWYPPIAALVTAALVYALTTRLTGHRWAGVAATVALAITPIHAVRTALGFAYHHAFDYVWLALTLLALVWLATLDRRWRSPEAWAAAVVVGFAVAGLILAWEGGAILLFPIAVYAAVAALSAVRTGRSPMSEHGLLLVGLGIGAALTVLARWTLGWHAKLPEIAYVPAMLFVGVLGVLVVAEAAYRANVPAAILAVIELLAFILIAIAVPRIPHTRAVLAAGIEYFTRTADATIVETVSLLGGPYGIVTGPLSLFGVLLVLALPAVAVTGRAATRAHRPAFLVVLVYAGCLFAFALVQRRFAGELAVAVAPLVGIGFLSIAQRLGIIAGFAPFETRRDRAATVRLAADTGRPALAVFLSVLVITAMASAYMLPVKMNQVTVDDDAHDAAQWMATYSDEQSLEYPENYVLSWWGTNRMYNYFVNFHSVPSLRYSYARSHYMDFLGSTSPKAQYEEHQGRVGFVVTTDEHQPPQDVLVSDGNTTTSVTMHSRLHDRLGNPTGGIDGLAHYRAVYASQDGSVKVFRLVPGATINGTAAPNTPLQLATEVALQHTTFTYTRSVTTDDAGRYSITVPYPGTYTIGEVTLHVPEAAVENGTTITGPPSTTEPAPRDKPTLAVSHSGPHIATVAAPAHPSDLTPPVFSLRSMTIPWKETI